jgi:carbonic anhydrase
MAGLKILNTWSQSEFMKANANGLNFHSFPNLEQNVRDQINKIMSTPFLPKDMPVYGFIYDVKTGKFAEVV